MRIARLLALCVAATSGGATAAPYAPIDVRAAGMGGTGVASAKAASAALFNPALLSAQQEGDAFQFVLGAGALADDEAETIDTVDDLQTQIDAFDAAAGAADDAGIYAAARDIRQSMTEIDGEFLAADLGAGLGIGVPGRKLGVGVFATVKAQALILPDVADSDYAFIDGVLADYEADNDIDTAPGNFPAQSEVTGIALAVAEYGVSLSHRFTVGNGSLDLGVTPKAVEVSTFEYNETIDNFDDEDLDSGDFETTDSGVDVDLGVVYKTAAESPWQFGLVAKNLVGGDYDTITGRQLSLDTQLRAGAARVTERTTLALDLDLTENEGLIRGTETQFLGFGAEYDLKYLQLRAGYRANLAGSEIADIATVGLGLGPLDISAQASDGTLGAYLQLGFGW